MLEETYFERLVGLTEMFPEPVRKGACCLCSLGASGSSVLDLVFRILKQLTSHSFALLGTSSSCARLFLCVVNYYGIVA